MLERVKINGFRCLRNVDVELKPLTVLIGPNDSGKSTFLEAIRLFSGEREKNTPSDFWLGDTNKPIQVEAMMDGIGYKYKAAGLGGESLPKIIPSICFFNSPLGRLKMESQGFPDNLGYPNIADDGGNIPSFLDYLLRKDSDRWSDISDTLGNLIKDLRRLSIATPDASTRRLDLVLKNGMTLQAARTSTGNMYLLFFVALSFHPTPPSIILLEEPENGFHPKRLVEVVSFLRDLTEGKHGLHRAQVILTTHSPYLVDHIDLDKDQVLVFRRNEDGSRTAEAADPQRLRLFLDEFMLGEVWYNQGEEGLLAQPS